MAYDAAGNLVDGTWYTFSYDATGQQTRAACPGYVLDQAYDGDRLRGKKIDNGTTTYYLRSSVLGGQVVAELNGSGAWTRGYVYLGGQMVALQGGTGGAVSWVHQDPVTKSQRITDSSGAVVSTIDLDPFGGDTSASSNAAFQPHRYTSYERDANGADDAMMRRYNRYWGRFDQPDPYDGSYSLANPQSLNRYAYVNNDPVNLTDPSGLLLMAIYGRFCVDTGDGHPVCITEITGYIYFPDSGGGGPIGGGIGDPGGGPGGGGPGGGGPGGSTVQNSGHTPPTDCQPFANMVAEIAGRHATSEGFMDEMARTFTAANNSSKAEMSANLEHALPPGRIQIGDVGFRPELKDGTNLQVRHFVGGLLYGYRYGYEGPMAAGAVSEALSPAPTGSMADVRLNDKSMAWGASAEPRGATVTGYMGAVIKTPAHPGYKGFADAIRRLICE
jgi:RHS repeat-associated protein